MRALSLPLSVLGADLPNPPCSKHTVRDADLTVYFAIFVDLLHDRVMLAPLAEATLEYSYTRRVCVPTAPKQALLGLEHVLESPFGSVGGSRATEVRENSEQLPGRRFRETTGVWHHGATSRWIGRVHPSQLPLLSLMHPGPFVYHLEMAAILPRLN